MSHLNVFLSVGFGWIVGGYLAGASGNGIAPAIIAMGVALFVHSMLGKNQ